MSRERQPQNRIRSKFCLVPQSGFSNVHTSLRAAASSRASSPLSKGQQMSMIVTLSLSSITMSERTVELLSVTV